MISTLEEHVCFPTGYDVSVGGFISLTPPGHQIRHQTAALQIH